jgi:predicted phage terminase large subunit-like protein
LGHRFQGRGNQRLFSLHYYYVIDVWRERLRYPDLKGRIIDHALRFGANSIIIEDKGSGIALIQELRRETADVPHPIAFTPEGDKVCRMHAQSAKIEAGQVHLPRRAGWLEEFRLELLQFPRARHDDQADSLSQFLAWLEQRNRNRWWVQPLEL